MALVAVKSELYKAATVAHKHDELDGVTKPVMDLMRVAERMDGEITWLAEERVPVEVRFSPKEREAADANHHEK